MRKKFVKPTATPRRKYSEELVKRVWREVIFLRVLGHWTNPEIYTVVASKTGLTSRNVLTIIETHSPEGCLGMRDSYE